GADERRDGVGGAEVDPEPGLHRPSPVWPRPVWPSPGWPCHGDTVSPAGNVGGDRNAPCGDLLRPQCVETGHPPGRLPAAPAAVPFRCMSSMATAHRFFAARPGSRALLDVAVAAVALVGTLALLSHGGVVPTRPGSHRLDLVGIVLAACGAVPLIAWRRFP